MPKRILSVVVGLAGGILPLAQPGRAETPPVVAIQDARIVTGAGAVLEKGTVVLERGLIREVGAAVTVPKGAWVIDAKGLTVYPGLIDAMSTLGLEQAAPAAAAGGRGGQAAATPGAAAAPRSWGPEDRPGTNSWVKAADLVKPSAPKVEAARAAGFTTAVTFPRTGIVAGRGAVVNLGGETGGEMVVDADAGMMLTLTPAGYSGFPNTQMGMFAYWRQLWIDAAHYKAVKAAYEKAPGTVERPKYDRALEGVGDVKRVAMPAPGPMQALRMLKVASDLKTPAVLYNVAEGWRMAEELKKSGTPVVLNVKWPTKERDTDPAQEESYKALELRDKAPTAPGVLASAGVKFAVSTDGLDAPKDAIKALKKAIDVGLKKEDAIRALTLSAAEIYGVEAKLGSIERGKIANLVVTNGDLFDERTKVQMVFVDGVKYLPPAEAPQMGPGGAGAGRTGAPTPNGEER